MAFWKREREGGRRQAAGAGRPAWDLEAGVGGVGPPRLETLALGGVCCPRTGQVSCPASQASAGPACPGSSSQPAKDGSPEPGPWALQPARTPAGARLGVGLQHVGGHPPGALLCAGAQWPVSEQPLVQSLACLEHCTE